jgi:hypothetical protein
VKIIGRNADGTLEEVATYGFRVVRPHESEAAAKHNQVFCNEDHGKNGYSSAPDAR